MHHHIPLSTAAARNAAAAPNHRSLATFSARINDVRESCKLSILAYSAEVSRNNVFGRVIGTYDGRTHTTMAPRCKDTQAFMLLRGEDELVVAFRGTMNLLDVKIALDVRQATFGDDDMGGRVHHGFLKQFTSIEPMLSDDIAKVVKQRKVRRICFTGHSMGAAMAFIAAKRYGTMSDVDGGTDIVCHAFGGPPFADKTFWHGFVDHVDDHVAINLRNDVVSVIPVNATFCSAPPNTLELTTDGTSTCVKDTQVPPLMSHLISRAARCGSMEAIITNHESKTYLHSIDRLLKRVNASANALANASALMGSRKV